jgi:glycosyltransferase involved in cell wall biosynthesis
LRILFVVDDLEGSYLSESALWLRDVAIAWGERGHRADVLCLHSAEPDDERELATGVRVWRPVPADFEGTLGELLAHSPDVVHVASPGPFGARVVEIMEELPVLLDVHDFWAVCPNDDLLHRPNCQPCGEHFPFAGCGECAGLTHLRAMDERTELARRARIVIAHSAFNRSRLVAGLDRPVEIVDYGVDNARFRPEPEPPLSPDIAELLADDQRPRVLFLGPPSLRRGAGLIVDLLLAVRSRIPEVELIVAGRDPANPDGDQVLRAEAKELGIRAALRCFASVPLHDLPALYAACDVAIAPAIGFEPGGLFVQQALATGVPVVASPLGAHEELIRHGEEGLLLPVQDLTSFAAGICSILLDPMARPIFEQAARLRALERHDRGRTLFTLEEIYTRLRHGTRSDAAA